MANYLDWAKKLEDSFLSSSGLEGNHLYKIFYSKIQRSNFLILFQNPGGETDGSSLEASTYYENDESDIVKYRNDPQYRIAAPLYNFLRQVVNADTDAEIAAIPMTNVIWHRSRNVTSLNIPKKQAISLARPGLRQIIDAVGPKVIFFTNGSFMDFKDDLASIELDREAAIATPNGRYEATIFRWGTARLFWSDQKIIVIILGHPSTYARREVWKDIIAVSKKVVQSVLSN